MFDKQPLTAHDIKIESRLTRVEFVSNNNHEELKEVRRTLWWLIGIVFSLNSTIIGLLVKGFEMI